MSFSQSVWEVKLHLSALKAGRRFQRCLSGLLDWPLSGRGSRQCHQMQCNSTAAVQVQPSRLDMVWQPYRDGKRWREKEKENGVGFSVSSRWLRCRKSSLHPFFIPREHETWQVWDLPVIVLSLASVCRTHSFLSRYLCHTKETNRDFFNIDMNLKHLNKKQYRRLCNTNRTSHLNTFT